MVGLLGCKRVKLMIQERIILIYNAVHISLLCRVQYKDYSVQTTVYSEQCTEITQYILQCTLYSEQTIQNSCKLPQTKKVIITVTIIIIITL